MKLLTKETLVQRKRSRPVRGAWIEIVKYVGEIDWEAVAPRKGRVD